MPAIQRKWPSRRAATGRLHASISRALLAASETDDASRVDWEEMTLLRRQTSRQESNRTRREWGRRLEVLSKDEVASNGDQVFTRPLVPAHAPFQERPVFLNPPCQFVDRIRTRYANAEGPDEEPAAAAGYSTKYAHSLSDGLLQVGATVGRLVSGGDIWFPGTLVSYGLGYLSLTEADVGVWVSDRFEQWPVESLLWVEARIRLLIDGPTGAYTPTELVRGSNYRNGMAGAIGKVGIRGYWLDRPSFAAGTFGGSDFTFVDMTTDTVGGGRYFVNRDYRDPFSVSAAMILPANTDTTISARVAAFLAVAVSGPPFDNTGQGFAQMDYRAGADRSLTALGYSLNDAKVRVESIRITRGCVS